MLWAVPRNELGGFSVLGLIKKASNGLRICLNGNVSLCDKYLQLFQHEQKDSGGLHSFGRSADEKLMWQPPDHALTSVTFQGCGRRGS